MPEYMIELQHNPDECSGLLNDMLEYNEDLLEMFLWGCKDGVHVGWALVEAEDPEDIREVLPPSAKDKARVIEVTRLTPEEMRRQHEAAS
jgi:hypothetical protein